MHVETYMRSWLLQWGDTDKWFKHCPAQNSNAQSWGGWILC